MMQAELEFGRSCALSMPRRSFVSFSAAHLLNAVALLFQELTNAADDEALALGAPGLEKDHIAASLAEFRVASREEVIHAASEGDLRTAYEAAAREKT